MYPNVHSSNVHNSQSVERAEMLFNRRTDKEDVVHVYNRILYLHQKVVLFLIMLTFSDCQIIRIQTSID